MWSQDHVEATSQKPKEDSPKADLTTVGAFILESMIQDNMMITLEIDQNLWKESKTTIYCHQGEHGEILW